MLSYYIYFRFVLPYLRIKKTEKFLSFIIFISKFQILLLFFETGIEEKKKNLK